MKKAVLVYYRTNMLLQGPFYKPLYGIKNIMHTLIGCNKPLAIES